MDSEIAVLEMTGVFWLPLSEPGEFWRDVGDWPGYAVSTFGRVASCRTRSGTVGKDWRIIAQFWSGSPSRYLYVTLNRNSKKLQFRVHRLVLETFCEPRPQGLVGSHDNGDRTCNRLYNLLYKTQKQNIADKERHGTKRIGSKIHTARIDEPKAVAILQRFLEVAKTQKYGAIPIVAREFGVSDDIVGRISRGKSWKHVCSPVTTTNA